MTNMNYNPKASKQGPPGAIHSSTYDADMNPRDVFLLDGKFYNTLQTFAGQLRVFNSPDCSHTIKGFQS